MLAQETFESKPSDLPAVVFCSTTTPRDQLGHLLNNKSRNIHASSTNDQKKFYICFSPLGRQLRKLSDVICLQNVMFNISKMVWAQMFICRAQTCTNDAQTNETNLNQFWHYWGAEWKKWNLNNLKIKRAQMFICRAQTCTNDAQMIETHLNRFGQYWGAEWCHMFTKCNVWYQPTWSHRNTWNDYGRITRNPWTHHGNTPISVMWPRNSLQCKLMTLLFRGSHTDIGVFPWCGHGFRVKRPTVVISRIPVRPCWRRSWVLRRLWYF